MRFKIFCTEYATSLSVYPGYNITAYSVQWHIHSDVLRITPYTYGFRSPVQIPLRRDVSDMLGATRKRDGLEYSSEGEPKTE